MSPMRANLIELCCGSAGLTLYALGAKHPGLMAYQGSKWRARKPLTAVLAYRGITELRPVLLNDAGPWGDTWNLLLDSTTLALTIEHLQKYADQVPSTPVVKPEKHPMRMLYDAIHGAELPLSTDPLFAAQHLFLQRISVNGKAVGTRNGKWISPGYNRDSAEGSKRKTFGVIHPMIPQLAKLLSTWSSTLDWGLIEERWTDPISGPQHRPLIKTTRCDARDIPVEVEEPTVVYIDPDYVNATGYPNGELPRPDLVDLSMRWASKGALVMISEAEPIEELTKRGWEAIQIASPNPTNASPFKSKKPEWVTLSP